MKEIELFNHKVAIFSDLHLGLHQHSQMWHQIAYDWAVWFRDQLHAQGITDIIFTGDLQHYRDEISVNTLHMTFKLLSLFDEFNIIILTGNHDAYYKDRADVNSLSLLTNWKNITVISDLVTVKLFGKTVTFVPWGVELDKIPKSDVIFGHFEIQSFKFNQFTVCHTGMTSTQILEKAPFVITGHFHLRESRDYTNGGHILYVGNPFQMDFGDMDSSKGYYILDFQTLKYDFYENTISPKHHKVSLAELAQTGKLTKDYKDKFRGNFVKLVIDRSISSDETDFLIQKLAELKPAVLTVDYAYTFDKFKCEDDKNLDLSGFDVATAIQEFVQLLDIPNKQEVADYTVDLYKRCK